MTPSLPSTAGHMTGKAVTAKTMTAKTMTAKAVTATAVTGKATSRRSRRSPRPAPPPAESWLSFWVRGVFLAVPVRRVVEVLPGTALTPDSQAPSPLLGFASVADGQIAVISLEMRLELEAEGKVFGGVESAPQGMILVVAAAGRRLGLLVDRIGGLQPVVGKAVQALPKELWGAGTEHLAGLVPVVAAEDERSEAEAAGEAGGLEGAERAPDYGWLTLLDVDSLLERPPSD